MVHGRVVRTLLLPSPSVALPVPRIPSGGLGDAVPSRFGFRVGGDGVRTRALAAILIFLEELN